MTNQKSRNRRIENMVKIKINGQAKEVAKNSTIQNLIDQNALKSNMFVVEKNLEIVPKENYSSITVSDGDEVEIVSFFGGG